MKPKACASACARGPAGRCGRGVRARRRRRGCRGSGAQFPRRRSRAQPTAPRQPGGDATLRARHLALAGRDRRAPGRTRLRRCTPARAAATGAGRRGTSAGSRRTRRTSAAGSASTASRAAGATRTTRTGAACRWTAASCAPTRRASSCARGWANRWTALEQMWVAERAHRSGRGYGPWPNTARLLRPALIFFRRPR